MRHFRSTIHRGGLSLVIAAVLIAAISQVPAAKNTTGRQGQAADGSFISATVNGELFTHTLSAGETAEEARNALVALIDADAGFMAEAITAVPPGVFEPDDVFYEVLTADGFEVDSMIVCENDANYTNSGVYFGYGKSEVVFRKPTAVAGGGVFDLRFDMVSAPDVNLDIPTVAGDLSGLLSAITSGLTALEFSVEDLGASFKVTKPGDYFRSARVESTDASIPHTCMGILGQSPPSSVFPLMSRYALVVLVVALLLAGVVIIRRKMAAAG